MFNLTRQEKTVILFLTGLALLGLGANYLFKARPQLKEITIPGFKKQKVNLNNASKEELISLPGIGEVLSQRIIEYRQNHGNFSAVEDLKGVKGMSNKTIEQIRGLIVIE